MLDSDYDSNSPSHVAESGSSVSLNVGKVMSVSGRGVGHLFLHLLTITGLSLVSLLDAMLGSAVVIELMWCGASSVSTLAVCVVSILAV